MCCLLEEINLPRYNTHTGKSDICEIKYTRPCPVLDPLVKFPNIYLINKESLIPKIISNTKNRTVTTAT